MSFTLLLALNLNSYLIIYNIAAISYRVPVSINFPQNKLKLNKIFKNVVHI